MAINLKGKYVLLVLVILPLFKSYTQQFKRIEEIIIPETINNNFGIGAADYDGDGFYDLMITKFGNSEPNRTNRLLRNKGDGRFEDVTAEAGLVLSQGGMSVSWADYDNDGDPDLFLPGVSENELYQNNGDGTFTDVSVASGVYENCSACLFYSGVWWDYDYDGYLDLYVVSHFVTSILYHNNGDGTFTKTDLLTESGGYYSWGALPMDFDNDDTLDLYVANDLDVNNFLYINKNGVFEESAVEYGVEDPYDGMGLAVNDYNNDGNFDFCVTNISENSFYENSGSGFINRSQDLNIFDTGWAWGLSFSDLDLDGYEDAFFVNQIDDNFQHMLFQNVFEDGQRTFSDISDELDINEDADSKGVLSFDYDNDGDLDLMITNNYARPHFYENTINESTTNNHVKFKLVGTSSNRDGIGTVVTVKSQENIQYRIYQGVGFVSQSQIPLHYGVGQATNLDSIALKWPSGTVDVYYDLPVNATIEFTEGEGYEVLEVSEAIKILGCTDPNSCTYNPEATTNDGSCEYLAPGTILGESQVTPLSSHTYTYDSDIPIEGYRWDVTGGERLSSADGEFVEVKWNTESHGELRLVANDETCSTEEINLLVTINFENIDQQDRFKDFSIARMWNEILLEAIRKDYARPTVHARNLFHSAVALYDSWAIYNEYKPYLLGQTLDDFISDLSDFEISNDEEAFNQTVSYACYRLLSHRFQKSPGAEETLALFDDFMNTLGYALNYTEDDYLNGDPRALGNYLASEIIRYGNTDGALEELEYANAYYEPVNEPLDATKDGNTTISDPNRWQPLVLDIFIDQSGNILRDNVPKFLSPEWGSVSPFSLTAEDLTTHERDGNPYMVYHDPGDPPKLDADNQVTSDWYKWGFSLVAIWAGHLSPEDNVIWDISPKSIGGIAFEDLPTAFEDFEDFYNYLEGGDPGIGLDVNPVTNQPYEEQLVPRGDYARVLAEFWADGPDSETPPGHWFTIVNYVNDHPELIKKIHGEGDVVTDLEWDIKLYFTLAGAMHDAAIAAWGVKGWYDYVRPISAIRYLAELGQSSDPELANYNPLGMPLVQGYIELVQEDDPLVGDNQENLHKIKLYTWKGHDYITLPASDVAGVGWILAEDWWPYQRPSFITPPFAGYVSGHSTYSRAAAEVLTNFTGSQYFPGGMGVFKARKNEFLVFEDGPSQDIELQWASYRDASDQCSLSRIWGGIHPPADDIPGRIIGKKVGEEAYQFARSLFEERFITGTNSDKIIKVYPNPLDEQNHLVVENGQGSPKLIGLDGKQIQINVIQQTPNKLILDLGSLSKGIYLVRIGSETIKIIR